MSNTLVRKVLDGDINAFRRIIQDHKDDAFSVAISVVKNRDLAKDIVQKSFINAYTKLHTFKGEATFSTWLYRIIVNEAYSQLRSQERQTKALEKLSSESFKSLSKQRKRIENDQKTYVNKALEKMSANYSLALRLFYLKEFSIAEISQITGCSESNTKVILHRARKEMKYIITEIFKIDKKELY